MKAIEYTKYGGADVLQLKEVPKPIPKGKEVLVKVFATTVNRTDCATVRAKPFFMRLATGLFRPNKPVPGTEFSGKIEAVGNEVVAFKVGDKVFGFNDMGLNTYAEYLVIAEDGALATMPENLSFEEAAASFEGAHYAYNFFNKVGLKAGDKVLVNGATGGIGSALVQLLLYFDADVVAVCGTENLDLIKAMGVRKVVDYKKEDFTKLDEKFKYVFDAVGKSSFPKCKHLLLREGIYMSSELGWMWQNIFFALIAPVSSKLKFISDGKKVLFPYPDNLKGSITLIKKLIEAEKFKALIDRKYPLEQIPEAFRYVEKGYKIGNVVIAVANDK